MCGITGFWQSPEQAEVLYSQVERMAQILAHRGPDDSGVFVEASVGLALGFRRLSILDLSPAGHQPMLSACGRYVIVFNGEIYNHHELGDELQQLGHIFRGHSDTEIILEGVALQGAESFIPRLWGMFAIALWDRQERTLLLARDRLGKKPLYYGRSGTVFMFGSELKAFHAHPKFDLRIDRNSLKLFFRHGYVPSPYTIYENVYKVMPGHYIRVRNAQIHEQICYWDALQIASQNREFDGSDEDAINQLEMLLRDATARRMIADVPIGAFLSGGIDSSTVVALMQAHSTQRVKTFSIGFHTEGYNEAEAAKSVAGYLGTDHTELYVTPAEAQAVIPLLPHIYDEPFADASQIPTYLVSKLARSQVTVSLSGDGGDELFAGYNRYMWAKRIWKQTSLLPLQARVLSAKTIHAISPTSYDKLYDIFERFLPARYHQRLPGDKLHKLADILAATGQDDLYKQLISTWKMPEQLVIDENGSEHNIMVAEKIRERIPDYMERMMYWDMVGYLPDDILVKVDRASMAVSLEARSPLLDHRVAEWAWSMPARLKQQNGQSKWVLRQVLNRYVPPSLIDRPKMGFGIPIDVWLRGPLRGWAEELLAENRIRDGGYLEPSIVRKTWQAHQSGNRNLQYQLWTVLMFQAWLDKYQ